MVKVSVIRGFRAIRVIRADKISCKINKKSVTIQLFSRFFVPEGRKSG